MYLGDTLTDKGVTSQEKKVEAIWKTHRPTDEKGVERFLGMINFLGRYVPDLSNTSEPLRNVAASKNVFRWEHEQEAAWKEVAEMSCRGPSSEIL